MLDTNTVYLIGSNISHSLSPLLNNYLYSCLDLNLKYDLLDINSEFDLYKTLDYVVANRVIAFNVTYPYKNDVYRYFKDEVRHFDLSTLFSKGCNFFIKGNYLYNYDGLGFVKFLQLESIDVSNKIVAVVGSGVTAMSICLSLLEHNVKRIFVLSRKQNIKVRSNYSNYKNKIQFCTYKTKINDTFNADIVVDATPIGMKGFEGCNFDKSSLNENQIICDVVYGNSQTELAKLAITNNCVFFDGLKMLISQAILCSMQLVSHFNSLNYKHVVFSELYKKANDFIEGLD